MDNKYKYTYLKTADYCYKGDDVFNKLKKEKYFLDFDNETILNKLVELFADINALHPFREGNGRSQRVFIESLAKINGIGVFQK